MANKLLDGGLVTRLTELREAELSFEDISRLLLVEAGVTVTAETIRKWVRQLEIEEVAS